MNTLSIGKRFRLVSKRPWAAGERTEIEKQVSEVEITAVFQTRAEYRVVRVISRDNPCPDQKPFSSGGFSMSAAAELGRLGGLVASEAQKAAARENGKRGGRPKKF